MNLTLSQSANLPPRLDVDGSVPASRPTVSTLEYELESLASQHRHLKTLIAREPALASLVFQGQTLETLATPYGLQLMQHAAELQDYDPVAMNHGIRRLRLGSYTGEVIWDYPGNPAKIIESDAITCALEQQATSVIYEVLACIDHSEKFPDSDSLTNSSGLWSYRSFYDRKGQINEQLSAICPRTAALIDSLRPNLTFGFAFISILDPNTTIASHKGSTSLRQRYHLGIRIPSDGVSRIRIGDTWKAWQEGKAFGFNDSIDHEVEHWSSQRRVVLIVDSWSTHVPETVVSAIAEYPDLLKLAILSQVDKSAALND